MSVDDNNTGIRYAKVECARSVTTLINSWHLIKEFWSLCNRQRARLEAMSVVGVVAGQRLGRWYRQLLDWRQ
jgi:hypothetical protein